MSRPTDFLCLALKLLQIQPEREVILELLRSEDHKYVRLLGAFYLRRVPPSVHPYCTILLYRPYHPSTPTLSSLSPQTHRAPRRGLRAVGTASP